MLCPLVEALSAPPPAAPGRLWPRHGALAGAEAVSKAGTSAGDSAVAKAEAQSGGGGGGLVRVSELPQPYSSGVVVPKWATMSACAWFVFGIQYPVGYHVSL